MSRIAQTGEFFVVGGPVQPDRACYIERPTDEMLRQSIRDQQFSYVVGPKASGKTSLMARTIRRLRAEGQLAAVVDLTQIGARGESAEAGRWFYSIAYRIVRELRLKVDLQTWWQDKSILMSEQRLTEFFWEIVLANTTTPVTIFFDEGERALELPFSRELFAALGACYEGRATEPDFLRLNFVVLGVATPRQLSRGLSLPLFEDGRAIRLQDFTLEETHHLAQGFASDETTAKDALARIHYWVKGHPYLTQKIARAAARRNGTVENVDAVVRERFLSQGARDEEPLLNHICSLLTERGTVNRRALAELGKVGKGTTIVADPDSQVHEFLNLAGVVTTIGDGYLTYRNRLFKEAFTSHWIGSALPFDWRGSAIATAVLAVMILVPLWYTQYFPRPYIDTLSTVTDDLDLALETHGRLRRLPGFAGTADGLLADVMRRRSESAQSYSEILAADEVLRALPAQTELADEILGAYWLRRAGEAVHGERRDEALVYASLASTGQAAAASELLNGLIDDDYPALARSFRFAVRPAHWRVDWSMQELTVVDEAQRGQRISVSDDAAVKSTARLTALQHVPVSRELGVDEPGSAGAFLFQIELEHPEEQQIMISLEAPSGAQVSFRLPPGEAARREIRVTERSELSALADEERRGVWRLTLVDQAEGSVGRLSRWGLLFAEELRGWEDVPEQGLDIPDPVRTDQIDVELSDDGRFGAARPSRPGAVGTLTLWDLTTGTPLGDIQLEAEPSFLAFTRDAPRLITVAGSTLRLWDTNSGGSVSRIVTQTEYVSEPAVGLDGEYIAIAERLETGGILYSLLRAADGELVSSVEGISGVRDWLLGPRARYLIVVGPSRLVRVMDPRRGEMLYDLPHQRDTERILASPQGDLVLSVDAEGDIFVWNFDGSENGELGGKRVGTTVDPQSVSVAADGSTIAYEAAHGHVVVRSLISDSIPLSARIHHADDGLMTAVSTDGQSLLTGSGSLLQLWQTSDVAPSAIVDDGISVMALDASGQLAALGFRGGHVQLRTTAQLQEEINSDRGIAYIGHQGAVASIDVDSANGVIASGGRDGLVRIWNLASGVPTAPFMRHPEGPIRDLELSGDGRWLASAAEYSARVWGTADGALALEVPVNGTALSVGIAPNSSTIAVGDSAGNLFIAPIASAARARSGRAQDAVTALAFTPDGGRLATGDRSGRIQLWNASAARPIGTALVLPHPVRWIGFSADGEALIAQTDHWVHRVEVAAARLTVTGSRLTRLNAATGAAVLGSAGEALRLVGGGGLGAAYLEEVDWQQSFQRPGALNDAVLERDWPRLLGLELNELAAITGQSY
ncbi:MAG TPA: AAA-like domain-containing protein [Gammaproteobacteria bacterium]